MSINVSIVGHMTPTYKPSNEEIEKIMEEHRLWRQDKSLGRCADFSKMWLQGYDFHGEDLTDANFRGADISRCVEHFLCK